MKRNSLAWVVIGGLVVGLGTADLAACSSSGGGNGFPSQPDDDATTTKDGTTNGEGSTGTDGSKTDGKTGTDGGAKECGALPTLHPRANQDGGDGGPIMNFFCPFSSNTGSKPDYCNSGTEHCCIPYAQGVLSTCSASCPDEPDGGPFDGRDIECLDPIDCTGGGICCGVGQVLQDPDCHNFFGKGFTGTKCASSCDANNNEFVLCQKDEQCENGQTCQAMSAAGAQFGVCQ
jgi:hypothetical protein